MTGRNNSERFLIGVIAVAMLTWLALGVFIGVQAAHGSPGEAPCSHGNSGQDCRPDPQPDHGKDCNQPNGDGNEDHCTPSTDPTPTPEPTIEPTTDPTPTPTPTVIVDPTPVPDPVPPVVVPSHPKTPKVAPALRLARTGVATVFLALAGFMLLAIGFVFRGVKR